MRHHDLTVDEETLYSQQSYLEEHGGLATVCGNFTNQAKSPQAMKWMQLSPWGGSR